MKKPPKSSRVYVVPYRRKRQGKTNYRKRLKLLQGNTTRIVVRKSLHMIRAQLVDYVPTGDSVKASATTQDIAKLGWKGGNNVPAAYLVGLLLARKAKHKKIAGAVADLGLAPTIKGSQLFAVLKGAIDGGLAVPVSKEIMPDQKRLNGEHIAHFAGKLDAEKQKKQFSHYLKVGLKPSELPHHVGEIKKKIMEM